MVRAATNYARMDLIPTPLCNRTAICVRPDARQGGRIAHDTHPIVLQSTIWPIRMSVVMRSVIRRSFLIAENSDGSRDSVPVGTGCRFALGVTDASEKVPGTLWSVCGAEGDGNPEEDGATDESFRLYSAIIFCRFVFFGIASIRSCFEA